MKYPITDEVLACQFSVTVCWEAAIPVPDTAICRGEFDALLAIETAPVIVVPAVTGAKLIARVADWLGVNVRFGPTPVALNPVPDVETPEIVMFTLPLFVTVISWTFVVLTTTFPKFACVAFAESWPFAAIPAPLRAIDKADGRAALVIEILPVPGPAAVGLNATVNVLFWPAGIVAELPDKPEMLNSWPDRAA
jgi:hypothetical protein